MLNETTGVSKQEVRGSCLGCTPRKPFLISGTGFVPGTSGLKTMDTIMWKDYLFNLNLPVLGWEYRRYGKDTIRKT